MTEEKKDATKEPIRIPNWLGEREDFHMQIKKEKKLTEYQVKFFARELRARKKQYDELVANTPNREASYKPVCKTREELDSLYMRGGMDYKEYMSQRSRIWQAYSDRGYIAQIEWLQEQHDRYKDKLDRINNYTYESNKEARKRAWKKISFRQKHVRSQIRYQKRQQKKKLEERWRKYGLIERGKKKDGND